MPKQRLKWVWAAGRVVGQLLMENDQVVFLKRVDREKHLLQKPPAWAVDRQLFEIEIRPHADVIRIQDRATGDVWELPVVEFDRFKETLDRGAGVQYFVGLERWCYTPGKARQLSLWR